MIQALYHLKEGCIRVVSHPDSHSNVSLMAKSRREWAKKVRISRHSVTERGGYGGDTMIHDTSVNGGRIRNILQEAYIAATLP